jgi:dTDP-4-amino-4,6-dideoxygalactose transaminase
MDEFNVPEFVDLGYNYKMSDIAAAIGVAQMRKLDEIIERKKRLARLFREELEGCPGISPPFEDERCDHIFQSYVSVVDENINRNKLIVRLLQKGIQTQIGTYACHVQPLYKSKDSCPVSKGLFARTLALPFYPSMLPEDVPIIVNAIKHEISLCHL